MKSLSIVPAGCTPVYAHPAWPTIELALQSIELFARQNKLHGEDLIAVLQAGIWAHQGFLIPEEERRPHHVQESLTVLKGRVLVAYREPAAEEKARAA